MLEKSWLHLVVKPNNCTARIRLKYRIQAVRKPELGISDPYDPKKEELMDFINEHMI